MRKVQKHIERIFGKRFWCISFLIAFTYLVGATPSNSFDLFAEKTAETEKEESKTEKESLDEETDEIANFGKCKKNKKFPTPPLLESYFAETYSTPYPLTALSLATPHIHFGENNVSLDYPFYIAYHKLIFYEI